MQFSVQVCVCVCVCRCAQLLPYFTSQLFAYLFPLPLALLHTTLFFLRGADPRSSYRREKCQDQEYAFTLDETDIFVSFTHDDVAVVKRVQQFQQKKEKHAGHLSQDLEDTRGSAAHNSQPHNAPTTEPQQQEQQQQGQEQQEH